MPDFLRPSFRNPPVAETVLSVQFEPIAGLTNAHLGAFWKALEGEWTNVADAPPLDPAFERFGDDLEWELLGLHIRLRTDLSSRLQIRNQAGDRMIQIQNGRLSFNWLKTATGDYPRYRAVKPGFQYALATFQRFIESHELPGIKPNQWEVTYVNHLRRGPLWESPDDWSDLLGGFMPRKSLHESIGLESVGGEWHFEIKPRLGRLHLSLQHGRVESSEGDESLIVKMTARGPIRDSAAATTAVDAGLDLGHNVIVDTFKRLPSEDAQRFWEDVS